MNNMSFEKANEILWNKLGDHKIAQIAACTDNIPSIRTISAIMIDHRIFFKTDKNFDKTKQLLANPKIAIAFYSVYIQGHVINHGLVVDEPGRVFEKKYKEVFWQSYNAYSHEDDEILIEVIPESVEIWDEDENRLAYQILMDFEQKTAQYIPYDTHQ